jgi:tetratricopeptide (TPR) repeat protein
MCSQKEALRVNPTLCVSRKVHPNLKALVEKPPVGAVSINRIPPLVEEDKSLNNQGNYTQAIHYLDKALAIDPNYKEALKDKGWALEGL